MTIIMPDFGKEDFYEEIEAEAELVREFLEGDYDGLNGLLLVSRALEGGLQISLEEEVPYYSHIYQDTGLPVICAGSPAVAGSRGSICIDMRPGYRIAFRRLPENTIYLDMTSSSLQFNCLTIFRVPQSVKTFLLIRLIIIRLLVTVRIIPFSHISVKNIQSTHIRNILSFGTKQPFLLRLRGHI